MWNERTSERANKRSSEQASEQISKYHLKFIRTFVKQINLNLYKSNMYFSYRKVDRQVVS